jgi:hypothetical protein
MGFEETMKKTEDPSPIGRVYLVVPDVRERSAFSIFAFEEIFEIGFGDIFDLLFAVKSVSSLA